MFLPLRTDSPLKATPWVNWALIVINVGVFLWQQVSGPGGYARFTLEPTDPQLFDYVAYAFLHGGWLHLIGNMLFLYIFGNNVCDKMGQVGYLAFYLAGAVFSGIAFVVTNPGPDAAGVIGASGAVAAVTGAYLVLLPRSHITVVYFFILIGVIQVPSFFFILFFFAKDLLMNFSGSRGIAHEAHIGGTVFGFTVSFILLAFKLLPRDHFDVYSLFRQWNRRRQYRDLVHKGFDPFGPGSEPADKTPPHPNAGRIMDLRAEISEATAHRNIQLTTKLYHDLKMLDAKQVLTRQTQLDVANQFAAEQRYPQAAEAYETFLRHYGTYAQVSEVQLMLGLVYSRYLNKPDLARPWLEKAIARLHSDREIQIAKEELAKIETVRSV